MKNCSHCNTDYALSETKCPSCGSPESKSKCENCGNLHESAFCPECGFGINEKLSECPKCRNKTKERICSRCGHDIASTNNPFKDAVASVASTTACKISGHRWLGCKCTRCGETRDKDHNFQTINGKCEQKCTVCGKTEKTPHQWNGNSCSRCGAAKGNFLIKNRKLSGFGIFLLIFIILMVFQTIRESPDSEGQIYMPRSPEDFQGENYHNVVDELKEAGFNNIKLIGLGDLLTGWVNDENSVKTVSVSGNTDYKTDKRYSPDVEIIISYHSFDKTETDETDEEETFITTEEITVQ